jgi:acetyl-CoA carboxylase carboxyl transferase subunit alpha
MLQYSTYSVISPEGCASILWKSADKKEAAADAMGLTADRLHALDLVDEIVAEPLGGAHRNPAVIAESLRAALAGHLQDLRAKSIEQLLEERSSKIAGFGVFTEAEG